jgi:hypothetical protein
MDTLNQAFGLLGLTMLIWTEQVLKGLLVLALGLLEAHRHMS